MPFDTVLAIIFIVLSVGVLLLRTHVGLSIMIALSSYFLISINLFELQNFIQNQLSLGSGSLGGMAIIIVLSLLPSLVVLLKLRNTARGRFFAHILPALLYAAISVTIIASIAANYTTQSYIEPSFLVGRLSSGQNVIFLLTFVIGLIDALTHYRDRTK